MSARQVRGPSAAAAEPSPNDALATFGFRSRAAAAAAAAPKIMYLQPEGDLAMPESTAKFFQMFVERRGQPGAPTTAQLAAASPEDEEEESE